MLSEETQPRIFRGCCAPGPPAQLPRRRKRHLGRATRDTTSDHLHFSQPNNRLGDQLNRFCHRDIIIYNVYDEGATFSGIVYYIYYHL